MTPRDAASALRAALAGRLAPVGGHPDVPPVAAGERYTPAAVLVPAVAAAGRLELVLTLRTAHLKSHPGQISFPGGHVEDADRDVGDTACREAVEELGIARTCIEPLGCLSPCITGTGYRVVPVVAVLDPAPRYAPDEYEVAEVFHVPLRDLLSVDNRREETRELRGRLVTYPVYDIGSRRIWGATARMIVELAGLLGDGSGASVPARFL